MTLRVTVEIVPYGIESEKYTLDVLEIYNVGRVSTEEEGIKAYIKDRPEICHYEARETTRDIKWTGVDHDRKKGHWDLILRTIRRNLNEI